MFLNPLYLSTQFLNIFRPHRCAKTAKTWLMTSVNFTTATPSTHDYTNNTALIHPSFSGLFVTCAYFPIINSKMQLQPTKQKNIKIRWEQHYTDNWNLLEVDDKNTEMAPNVSLVTPLSIFSIVFICLFSTLTLSCMML